MMKLIKLISDTNLNLFYPQYENKFLNLLIGSLYYNFEGKTDSRTGSLYLLFL